MIVELIGLVFLVGAVTVVTVGLALGAGRLLFDAERHAESSWTHDVVCRVERALGHTTEVPNLQFDEFDSAVRFSMGGANYTISRVPLRSRGVVLLGWLPGEGSYEIEVRRTPSAGSESVVRFLRLDELENYLRAQALES